MSEFEKRDDTLLHTPTGLRVELKPNETEAEARLRLQEKINAKRR